MREGDRDAQDGTLPGVGGAAPEAKPNVTSDRRLVSGAENNIARIWRLDDIEPPPHGSALRQWLDTHTNLEEQKPDQTN